jgi:hypothetical protein
MAPGIIAGASGQCHLRAGTGRDHRDVGDDAAKVRHERFGLNEVVDRPLADEIDQRLAEA